MTFVTPELKALPAMENLRFTRHFMAEGAGHIPLDDKYVISEKIFEKGLYCIAKQPPTLESGGP
jgi:hypothetical protein